MHTMAESSIYELTENDCYSSLTKQRENTATSTMGMTRVSTTGHSSSKCFHAIVVLAILLNFLLIIGVGAALAYYQTKMASEVKEINQGLVSRLSNGSTSGPAGPPGPQGT